MHRHGTKRHDQAEGTDQPSPLRAYPGICERLAGLRNMLGSNVNVCVCQGQPRKYLLTRVAVLWCTLA